MVVKLEIDFWQTLAGGPKTIQMPSGEKLEVQLPKGLSDGQVLKIQGRGKGAPDVLLEIHVKQDDKIKTVDRILLEIAKNEKILVATQDKQLKKLLRLLGARIIDLRKKQYLILG